MRIVGTNLPEDAWINPVAAVAIANITLSGQQTVDGVTVGQFAAGDPRVQRVLATSQTDPTTSGVYNATQGSWTRALDANDGTQWAQGVQIKITGGTVNSGAIFALTSAGTNGQIVLGKTALTFAQLTFANVGGSITQTQLPASTIRKPPSAATVPITASDLEVGIDTRLTPVTANLPSIASWVAANPSDKMITLFDYFGNAGTNNVTPAVNGADSINWGGVTPKIVSNFGILRLRPDLSANAWMVYQLG
jgi:hypothetical protein